MFRHRCDLQQSLKKKKQHLLYVGIPIHRWVQNSQSGQNSPALRKKESKMNKVRMNTESDMRNDEKQRRGKKKGRERWKTDDSWAWMSLMWRSQAGGGGGQRFFTHWKPKENGQIKKVPAIADREMTSLSILPTSHLTAEQKLILIKTAFYMLFLASDQSVASLVNIFLKVPKCVWNMSFCYNPNGLQSLQAVVSSTRVNNVVPKYGWRKPPETYQELKRETL